MQISIDGTLGLGQTSMSSRVYYWRGVWLLEPPLLQLPQTKMMNKVIKVLQAHSFYYKADWLFSTKSAIQSLNQKKAFNK